MDDPEQIEVHRRRWREARRALHMEDPECEEFGRGRIPGVAEEIRARLLILPADPEGHCIRFDQSFWEWWALDPLDPHTNQASRFGVDTSASVDSAYRFRGAASQWERFVALAHSGAFEMCLGWDAVFPVTSAQGDVDVFCLLSIVGKIAAALAHYGQVREKFDITGPWEVTVGLRCTKGALLGYFASGWPDVGGPRYVGRKNSEENLLMRREIQKWPEEDGVRELAYELGDQIENSWGFTQQRYLANSGDYAGRFDVGRYLSRE